MTEMNMNDTDYYTTDPLIQPFHLRSSSKTSHPLCTSFLTLGGTYIQDCIYSEEVYKISFAGYKFHHNSSPIVKSLECKTMIDSNNDTELNLISFYFFRELVSE